MLEAAVVILIILKYIVARLQLRGAVVETKALLNWYYGREVHPSKQLISSNGTVCAHTSAGLAVSEVAAKVKTEIYPILMYEVLAWINTAGPDHSVVFRHSYSFADLADPGQSGRHEGFGSALQ